MNNVKCIHISLNKGQLYRLDEGARVLCFQCKSGSAWLTVARDVNDYVVRAGEKVKLGGKGLVIESLSEALEMDIEICA